MNIEEKKRDLALFRPQQAEESLDEAKFLYDGRKSPRSVINRAYYTMFYLAVITEYMETIIT